MATELIWRRMMPRQAAAIGAGLLVLLVLGCDQPGDEKSPPRQSMPSTTASPTVPPSTRQERFLARIQQAAVGNHVIRTARMNGDNELGVVLDKQVELVQVRPLLTTLLREMRTEFPGHSLQVIAYAPNGQPLATMRYDPAAPPDANVIYQPNF